VLLHPIILHLFLGVIDIHAFDHAFIYVIAVSVL